MPALSLGLNFFRKSKRMSVLMFSVGMEKPCINCFVNVCVNKKFVERSDLFWLPCLRPCRFQRLSLPSLFL